MLVSEIDVIPDCLRKCMDCGSDVHHYCCNKDIIKVRPEAAKWDWWTACDNVKCVNHYGEGIFQTWPLWDIDHGANRESLRLNRIERAKYLSRYQEEPRYTLKELEERERS